MAEAAPAPKPRLTERLIAIPSFVWFAAAGAACLLGSETWPWMLAMPFVTHFLVWRERQTEAGAAAGGAEPAAPAAAEPAKAAKAPLPSRRTKAAKAKGAAIKKD